MVDDSPRVAEAAALAISIARVDCTKPDEFNALIPLTY
jgi:hypothetical protein